MWDSGACNGAGVNVRREPDPPPPPLRAVPRRLDAVIERVDFVGFLTQDVRRAKRFCTEVLGLEVESEGEHDIEFTLGQVTLDCSTSSISRPFASSIAGFALRVDDVDARRAGLGQGGRVRRRHDRVERLQAGVVQGSGRQRADAASEVRRVITIEKVDFLGVPALDPHAADAYYRDVFGLFERNPRSTPRWVEYEAPNVTLAIVPNEYTGREHKPLPFGAVAVRVDDVDASGGRLASGGCQVRGRHVRLRGLQRRRVHDALDGNGMLLHRRYAPFADGQSPDTPGPGRLRRGAGQDLPPVCPWRSSGQMLGLGRNANSTDTWVEYETENLTLALVRPEQIGQPFEPLPGWDDRVPRARRRGGRGRARGAGRRSSIPAGVIDSGVCHLAPFSAQPARADAPPALRAVQRRHFLVRIERLDFVSVPTRDVERAVAWYREVPELPESEYSERRDRDIERHALVLEPRGGGASRSSRARPESGCASDVHEAVEELRAAGGEVIGIEDSGVYPWGSSKDLDGSVLVLHRRYAPKEKRDAG